MVKANAWSTCQLDRNVFRVNVPYKKNKGWEQWVLLSSDRHWDNPKSNHELQEKHLEEAVERDAPVVDCGDFYCCMQGKYDPRHSKGSLRPEHKVDNYLDALVNTGAEWFAPYASQFVSIGVGNHESSIRKKYETCLIERLISQLNYRTGSSIYNGGYSGWVIFKFEAGSGKSTGGRQQINLHYDHGYGGGGITQALPKSMKRSIYLPDAHIIISGHTHDSWSSEITRVRINSSGKVYQEGQTHIKLPTYKEEYGTGFGGWHVETGKPPKPVGAWWLRFYYCPKRLRVLYDVIRAR